MSSTSRHLPSTSEPCSRSGPARRRVRRPGRWLTVIAAVVLPMSVLTAPAALAADGPFTIDGVVPDAGAVQLTDPSGNVKELGPINSNTTKIGVIHRAGVPMLGRTNPNGQVDLRNAWLTTARDSATSHDWLYFAWERDANSGSGFIAYEFMKNPAPAGCDYTTSEASLIESCNPWANRSAGDFVILWDQSGGSTDLSLRTWTGTAPDLVLGAPVALDDAVSQASFSADGFRGEAAVDLTDTVFGGSTACRTFANTIPSTVTGNSDTADYKDTVLRQAPPITNCTSTTVTTPQTAAGQDVPAAGLSIGNGVVAVRDSAVVSLTGGTATPAGTVSFSLCKVDTPALCTTGGTPVGSTSLSGSSYPVTVSSPTAYVTSVGRYCWRATFSGDAVNGIPSSEDARANECFTVNPVTPTLSTTAGDDVLLGGTVSDTALLSGTATRPADPVINLSGAAGPAAGGSLVFTLYGPDDCTSVAYTSAAVAVSGNGSYGTPAPQFAPTRPGTYHWVASYSGSPNTSATTHNSTCTDVQEDVVVDTAPSTLTSAQTWVPNDAVTVASSAGGPLAGTVTFALYATIDCAVGGDAPIYTTTAAVAGASPQTVSTSNSTAQSASGSFSWRVSYDSTNSAQDDIPASCQETSSLTVSNGGIVSSP